MKQQHTSRGMGIALLLLAALTRLACDNGTAPTVSGPIDTVAWTYETGGEVFSSPLVVDDVLYGISAGDCISLQVQSGQLRWRYMATITQAYGSPVSCGAFLYYAGRMGDDALFAVDRNTFAPRWDFPLGGWVTSTPACDGKTIFVGSLDSTLYAVDAVGGVERWRFKTGDRIMNPPRVHEDYVFVSGEDGVLYALTSTGTIRWHREFGAALYLSSVQDGFLYAGDDNGLLHAIDIASGTVSWEYKAGDGIATRPAVSRSAVFVTSKDSCLHAVQRSSGTLSWKYHTGGRIYSSPILDGKRVYFGSNDGVLYALDAATGAEAWKFAARGWIYSAPVVTADRLYFGTTSGTYYALNRAALEENENGVKRALHAVNDLQADELISR